MSPLENVASYGLEMGTIVDLERLGTIGIYGTAFLNAIVELMMLSLFQWRGFGLVGVALNTIWL